jgi:hypothetical protein
VGAISAPEWREHWPGAVRADTAAMTRAVVHWPDADSDG